MKYSINPFKWLLWLWRWAKWRNTLFAKFNTGHRPLNKKGKAALMDELKAAHARTKFKPPIARTGKESEE